MSELKTAIRVGRYGPTLRVQLALQPIAGVPNIPLGQLPPGTYSATVVSARVDQQWKGHGPNRSQWRRYQGL